MMNHWTQSTIKGGGDFPRSLTDKWMKALASGRYNDSNSISGDNAVDAIFLSQTTNVFISIEFGFTAAFDNYSGQTWANTLPDLTNFATELTTNTDLTLTHIRGRSSDDGGKDIYINGGKKKQLHWSYCISTITASTNTNADGVPIGQRMSLIVSSSISNKTKITLIGDKQFLKIIEIGQGYENVAMPTQNEICPAYLRSCFMGMIKSYLVGMDESLTIPRCKNYILPQMGYTVYDARANETIYIPKSIPVFNGTLFDIIKYSRGSEANGSVRSYSTLSDIHKNNVLMMGDVMNGNSNGEYMSLLIEDTSVSKQLGYTASGYTEYDAILHPQMAGYLDIKDTAIIVLEKTTLFLKNQFPGAYSVENKLNQLNEFYRIIDSGISSARMPIDNVTASIMTNTLDLPFYNHTNDLITSAYSTVVNGVYFSSKFKIGLTPFSLTYGYEIADAIASQYDIFDDTHNIYIKINV